MGEGELRTLAEAATPGPWDAHGRRVVHHGTGSIPVSLAYDDGTLGEADAAFVAAADPIAVLALLDSLASLRAENERLREALMLMVADYDDPGLGFPSAIDTARAALARPSEGSREA